MSSSQTSEMNIESCTDYRLEALFEVNSCDYNATYFKEIRQGMRTGTTKKETVGLWKDNLSEGILIIKITEDDLSTEFDVSFSFNDPNNNLKDFVSSWMQDVLKKDIFTDKENYGDLMTLQTIVDIVKLNIF